MRDKFKELARLVAMLSNPNVDSTLITSLVDNDSVITSIDVALSTFNSMQAVRFIMEYNSYNEESVSVSRTINKYLGSGLYSNPGYFATEVVGLDIINDNSNPLHQFVIDVLAENDTVTRGVNWLVYLSKNKPYRFHNMETGVLMLEKIILGNENKIFLIKPNQLKFFIGLINNAITTGDSTKLIAYVRRHLTKVTKAECDSSAVMSTIYELIHEKNKTVQYFN